MGLGAYSSKSLLDYPFHKQLSQPTYSFPTENNTMLSQSSPPESDSYPELAVTTTSPSQHNSLEPGKSLTLGITIANKSAEAALDVDVTLDGLPADITVTTQPVHPRLALLPKQNGNITFQIHASRMALPRTVAYTLVVSDPNRGGEAIEKIQHYLQILPVDRTEQPTETPTFRIEPTSSSTNPQQIQPHSGLPIQVWVDNRSELVDRFRLQCEGLPKGWEVTITYPQDALGLGLMVAATNLGLNPGDSGQILLMIKPPPHAEAGIYTPTLRLISENHPDLSLLQLLYLEVPADYLLQPTLHSLRSQFQKDSALFELQLTNNGNSLREVAVTLESLDESDRYECRLQTERVKILPQTTQSIELEVIPKRQWRRPLYGGGHFSNFRLKLQDLDNNPLTPETLQGNFTWQARPWWQLLLGVLIALGLISGSAALIWYFLLRPPAPPKVLLFEPTETSYSAANDEFAEVNFQIEHPEQVKTIRLTGYDPDGKILSAPIVYDLQGDAAPEEFGSDSLPHELKPLCNIQPQENLLTCNRVHTGASVPNTYMFELVVQYARKNQILTVAQQSKPVTIAPIPIPAIAEFRANQALYFEAGNPSEGAITTQGVELAFNIINPQQVDELRLSSKATDGKIIGEEVYPIWGSEARDTLHPVLEGKGCKPSDNRQLITCDKFFTTLHPPVGTFEISADLVLSPSITTEESLQVVTEPITIHHTPVSIDSFMVNGENAKPKYVIPLDPNKPTSQTLPGVNLAWTVSGGASMKVELLLPNPQVVEREGSIFFPITPDETRTITLQVTDGAGEVTARTVEIQAVNPNPTDPKEVAAAAAAAAVEAMQDANQPAPGGEVPFGAPSTTAPGEVSPAEQPPQFN